jgi:hypothetical protein
MKRLEAFRVRVLETEDGVENVADVVEDALRSVGAGEHAELVREAIGDFLEELRREHGF